MADNNGIIGFHGIRPDNIITYITPSIGGFQFAVATLPGAGGTRSGDINRKADSLTDGYSLAATYGGSAQQVVMDFPLDLSLLRWGDDTTTTD